MSKLKSTHLYIKHAVGSRMLLDVSGTQKPFTLQEVASGWKFAIEDIDADIASMLETNAQALNLFYFNEQPGSLTQKAWFYDKDVPRIEYDADTRRCTIQLDSKMDYNNEKV